jgi:hypothetical protein
VGNMLDALADTPQHMTSLSLRSTGPATERKGRVLSSTARCISRIRFAIRFRVLVMLRRLPASLTISRGPGALSSFSSTVTHHV